VQILQTIPLLARRIGHTSSLCFLQARREEAEKQAAFMGDLSVNGQDTLQSNNAFLTAALINNHSNDEEENGAGEYDYDAE